MGGEQIQVLKGKRLFSGKVLSLPWSGAAGGAWAGLYDLLWVLPSLGLGSPWSQRVAGSAATSVEVGVGLSGPGRSWERNLIFPPAFCPAALRPPSFPFPLLCLCLRPPQAPQHLTQRMKKTMTPSTLCPPGHTPF